MPIDYKAVLQGAFEEFGDLWKQRQEIDLKVAQKLQFIRATMNQLPEEDAAEFEDHLQRLVSGATLMGSVRTVLSENRRKWFTAAKVRDEVKKGGFEFTNYSSNPLASVHSALKRLKQDEVETDTVEGVMVWRWKGDRFRARRLRRRAAFYGEGLYGSGEALRNLGALRDMLNPVMPKEKK
jgi:hypothetical protein